MKPIQPIVDSRFVENKIVSYLLDNGGICLNKLAVLDFSDEDRAQFAQLIGYSLSGYGDLSYVSDEAYDSAEIMMNNPDYTESQAQIEVLKSHLTEAREGVKLAATALFRIHEDDLTI